VQYHSIDLDNHAVKDKMPELQPPILEVAILDVKSGLAEEFEVAFKTASKIIMAMPGYISHELQRCVETRDRYILLVRWQKLDDHIIGFRRSPEYQEWRSLLHHFYDPFPIVEHYEIVLNCVGNNVDYDR
jgi:heme-degrading monooxygenase HmoA